MYDGIIHQELGSLALGQLFYRAIQRCCYGRVFFQNKWPEFPHMKLLLNKHRLYIITTWHS
jgi:hypothetical protein